jgi:RimJ/RimL family protein N-acetyltransferase
VARTNGYGQPIGDAMDGWTPRERPPRTPMEGRYCRVEPLDERHAADLFDAWNEAPDDRDWTYKFPEQPADASDCLAYVQREAKSTDPLHFAIVDLATGSAVGSAALMRIDQTHGVIEVGGISYSPRLKRTRAGTEAMYLMMRRVFDELGYRRYEWKCDSLNAPSRAAALRYGFQFEGTFRQVIVYKGRNRDTTWYSILDREWPAIRAAFETWLCPDNFDAAGRQRRSLADIRPSSSAPSQR